VAIHHSLSRVIPLFYLSVCFYALAASNLSRTQLEVRRNLFIDKTTKRSFSMRAHIKNTHSKNLTRGLRPIELLGCKNTRNKINKTRFVDSGLERPTQLPLIHDQPSSQKQSHQEKEENQQSQTKRDSESTEPTRLRIRTELAALGLIF
jgi:hypothetical protein